jgi:orotidine-5'-phosphate decarboxylase
MSYPTSEAEVRSRLCWSADVDESPALVAQAKLMPGLEMAKVDRAHWDENGPDVIEELNELGIKVFDDAKPSEIPSKLEKIAKIHCKHRPWMLNVMADSASGGMLTSDDVEELEGLKRFADVCHQHDVRPCAVTVLTSTKPEFALKKYGKPVDEQVLLYVELLLNCGFTDIVCSPQEVPMIRAESRFDGLSTINPGIKRKPGTNKDQARTATPAEAFHLGCDVLVIGRDLTTGDPVQNMSDIVADVLAAA